MCSDIAPTEVDESGASGQKNRNRGLGSVRERGATLVNEVKAFGTYEVKFSAKGASPPSVWRGSASGGDASGLSSGVYLYRLTTGFFVQSRKMLLIR